MWCRRHHAPAPPGRDRERISSRGGLTLRNADIRHQRSIPQIADWAYSAGRSGAACRRQAIDCDRIKPILRRRADRLEIESPWHKRFIEIEYLLSRTKSDRSAAAPGLAYSTEEMMHPLGYLFALVGQGAMTAVCQLDLCVWHYLAIPQLIFTREQNIVLPADNQRRRIL